MLEKNDLDQFRGIMREEIGDALEQVVLPRFAAMDEEISGMKAAMVTKDYLDDKLADFKASLKNSAAWVGRQMNRLVTELHKGSVLTAEQVIQIRAE